jgi:hypothetical protein
MWMHENIEKIEKIENRNTNVNIWNTGFPEGKGNFIW